MITNRGNDTNIAIDSICNHCGYKTPVTTIMKYLQKETMNVIGYPQFL